MIRREEETPQYLCVIYTPGSTLHVSGGIYSWWLRCEGLKIGAGGKSAPDTANLWNNCRQLIRAVLTFLGLISAV